MLQIRSVLAPLIGGHALKRFDVGRQLFAKTRTSSIPNLPLHSK